MRYMLNKKQRLILDQNESGYLRRADLDDCVGVGAGGGRGQRPGGSPRRDRRPPATAGRAGLGAVKEQPRSAAPHTRDHRRADVSFTD